MKFKNELKERAAKSSKSNRDVFDEVSREQNPEIASSISFPQVVRGMSKRKISNFPVIPTSIIQFAESISNAAPDLNKFFKSTILVDNTVIGCLFYSESLAQKLGDITSICYDGTFFIVPKLFGQLFIISCKKSSRYLPVFFVLMKDRKNESYIASILKIRELVPNFQPLHAISDFERASMNAMKAVFPQIIITGCLFHYKQAIFRKLGNLHLSNYFLKNRIANSYFKLFMGIGFLPQENIINAFNYLKLVRIGNTAHQENINKFIDYFERTWIPQIHLLSYYDANILTNNFSETFNKRLKSSIGVHHANPWSFLEKLNNIIIDLELDSNRIDNGLQTTRQRNPDTLQIVSNNLKNHLECGLISIFDFLFCHLNISDVPEELYNQLNRI